MITAHSLNVAKFIIQKAKSPVSNLKLQKLLYYVQGWHLGIYGEPVFSQPIQAWIHGPVVPYVFGKFKEYKWISIPPDPTTVVLTQNLETHVVKVLNAISTSRQPNWKRFHIKKPHGLKLEKD